MQKKDYIWIAIIIAVVLALLVVWKLAFSESGSTVSLSIDDQIIYEDKLADECWLVIEAERVIVLNSETEAYDYAKASDGVINIVVIEDGKVDSVYANCPDKVCVNMPDIDQVGESIVCMPNRLVITVK